MENGNVKKKFSILKVKENNEKQAEENKKIDEARNKKKKMNRHNNSLEELTRKFIRYVLENKSNCVDLNEFKKKMKVQKRRIYDITNVLEGK